MLGSKGVRCFHPLSGGSIVIIRFDGSDGFVIVGEKALHIIKVVLRCQRIIRRLRENEIDADGGMLFGIVGIGNIRRVRPLNSGGINVKHNTAVVPHIGAVFDMKM